MYEQGVKDTTIDEVLVTSGTGKSQFYHYFTTKDDLVVEVLDHQLDQLLAEQSRFSLDGWQGVQDWLDAIAQLHESQRGLHGCPLGSIVSEVVDRDEHLRVAAAGALDRWEESLAAAIRGLQDRGLLRRDVDPHVLAEATAATIQGAYLISSAKRDIRPMHTALTAALSHLKSFAPSERRPARRG